jgi:hypothetical protein
MLRCIGLRLECIILDYNGPLQEETIKFSKGFATDSQTRWTREETPECYISYAVRTQARV